jgi:uncharacterized protein YbjT (DUF2867 family)
MLVTVMGATGKTGHVVAERLLAAGVQVRALGRSPDNLAPLAKAGAQPVVADVNRSTDLTAAFRGADAVYALVPPLLTAPDILAHYDKVNGAIASALSESGVKRVIYLSSIGADQPSGTGPVVGLHRGEEKLKALPGLDLLLLRPGYFYENHFGAHRSRQKPGGERQRRRARGPRGADRLSRHRRAGSQIPGRPRLLRRFGARAVRPARSQLRRDH